MKLIKNGGFVEDRFATVGDEDQLPDGPVIVSLERWQAEGEALRARNTPVGVRLKSGQEPSPIVEDLDKLDVVALEFPTYRNGRAYSYARLLRERHGYKGAFEMAASSPDLFQFTIRCGIDALEVADNITPEIWAENVGSFSLYYQPAADGRETVLSLRHRLAQRRTGARRRLTAPHQHEKRPGTSNEGRAFFYSTQQVRHSGS